MHVVIAPSMENALNYTIDEIIREVRYALYMAFRDKEAGRLYSAH